MPPPGLGPQILRRLRRRVLTTAAISALLVAGQIAMPLVAAGHWHVHADAHAHAHAYAHGAAQSQAERGQSLDCGHRAETRDAPRLIVRGAAPGAGHFQCALCHLIAGSQPTLLLAAEAAGDAAVPEVGRVNASVARRAVRGVLTGAMPRAPPVAIPL